MQCDSDDDLGCDEVLDERDWYDWGLSTHPPPIKDEAGVPYPKLPPAPGAIIRVRPTYPMSTTPRVYVRPRREPDKSTAYANPEHELAWKRKWEDINTRLREQVNKGAPAKAASRRKSAPKAKTKTKASKKKAAVKAPPKTKKKAPKSNRGA